jgi:hypothetical protein
MEGAPHGAPTMTILYVIEAIVQEDWGYRKAWKIHGSPEAMNDPVVVVIKLMVDEQYDTLGIHPVCRSDGFNQPIRIDVIEGPCPDVGTEELIATSPIHVGSLRHGELLLPNLIKFSQPGVDLRESDSIILATAHQDYGIGDDTH